MRGIILASLHRMCFELTVVCSGGSTGLLNLTLKLITFIKCQYLLVKVLLSCGYILLMSTSPFLAKYSIANVSYLFRISMEIIHKLWYDIVQIFNHTTQKLFLILYLMTQNEITKVQRVDFRLKKQLSLSRI